MCAFVLVDAWTLNSQNPKVFDLDRNPLQLPPQEIDRFKRKFHKIVTKLPKGAACCAVAISGNMIGPETAKELRGGVLHAKKCHSPMANHLQNVYFDKQPFPGKSEHGLYHAEEQLLISCGKVHGGTIDLDIDSMLIDIEPCYGGRYPGHCCTELFKPMGRKIQTPQGTITLKFSPKYDHAYTPIFFLTYQPPKGEKADAQAWKPKELGVYIDRLVHLIGPPPGVTLFKLGSMNH